MMVPPEKSIPSGIAAASQNANPAPVRITIADSVKRVPTPAMEIEVGRAEKPRKRLEAQTGAATVRR